MTYLSPKKTRSIDGPMVLVSFILKRLGKSD